VQQHAATGAVYHVVICWLKEPDSAVAREELSRVSKQLVQIPGVTDVQVGRKLSSPRPVVDSSYDLAIVFSLRDETALQKYLQHPLHRQAAQDVLKPLTRKVVIYDFVVADR
jgi:hypothetical protein